MGRWQEIAHAFGGMAMLIGSAVTLHLRFDFRRWTSTQEPHPSENGRPACYVQLQVTMMVMGALWWFRTFSSWDPLTSYGRDSPFSAPSLLVELANIVMLFAWPYLCHTMLTVAYSRDYLHPMKREVLASLASRVFYGIATACVFLLVLFPSIVYYTFLGIVYISLFVFNVVVYIRFFIALEQMPPTVTTIFIRALFMLGVLCTGALAVVFTYTSYVLYISLNNDGSELPRYIVSLTSGGLLDLLACMTYLVSVIIWVEYKEKEKVKRWQTMWSVTKESGATWNPPSVEEKVNTPSDHSTL